MTDQFVLRRDPPLAWIINSRPEALNALTTRAWLGFNRILDELERDKEIRVVILAGEGRGFCAGADVSELAEHPDQFARNEISSIDGHAGQNLLQDSTRKIRSARFPVIAAIHGVAVGAGLEVCCACDLVVAEEDTRMGFPEVNVGVTITNGGSYFAPRVFGLAKARELAYTGEFILAQEAYRLGAISRVVPKGEVRQAAEELGRRIASRAPIAVTLHKRMLDRGLESPLETCLVSETEMLLATARTLDHKEGARAFLEKREPKFIGS
jgi:enoyl-CoA hydratase/carnithine racemase